ncbi:MAG: hypothetical protein QM736_30040 [Vicinamibacterales bacterium]
MIGLPVQSPSDVRRKSPDLSSTSPLWSRWGQEGVARFLQTARNPRGNHADTADVRLHARREGRGSDRRLSQVAAVALDIDPPADC